MGTTYHTTWRPREQLLLYHLACHPGVSTRALAMLTHMTEPGVHAAIMTIHRTIPLLRRRAPWCAFTVGRRRQRWWIADPETAARFDPFGAPRDRPPVMSRDGRTDVEVADWLVIAWAATIGMPSVCGVASRRWCYGANAAVIADGVIVIDRGPRSHAHLAPMVITRLPAPSIQRTVYPVVWIDPLAAPPRVARSMLHALNGVRATIPAQTIMGIAIWSPNALAPFDSYAHALGQVAQQARMPVLLLPWNGGISLQVLDTPSLVWYPEHGSSHTTLAQLWFSADERATMVATHAQWAQSLRTTSQWC